jgi:hypothetical protein
VSHSPSAHQRSNTRSSRRRLDLTLAGAIPEIDDLASLGLDFWASGQGFDRIEPGLVGLCTVSPSEAERKA